MAESTLRLAAIAIGRNEGARLERCLRSLDPARVPVIYVDSGSTEGSQDLAKLVRVAMRDGWFAARLAITGKYAELIGIARFLGRSRGRTGGMVSYK